jgi:thioredoxin 1
MINEDYIQPFKELLKAKGVIMREVMEITDQSFKEEVLNSETPVEVDFWAPWCGPCRMVGPIYEKLARDYDNFKFCKINVDEHQEVARQFGIQSIPMQMFFADGKKVDEILGAVPEGIIRAKVKEIIEKYPTDEKSKLKSILASIIEHNGEASGKYQRWVEKADGMKESALYASISKAMEELETFSSRLSQLVKEI